jgi:DNA invertase Pin-like site-specific DNA recombinase
MKGALFLVSKRGRLFCLQDPSNYGGLSDPFLLYQIPWFLIAICACFMDTLNMRNSVVIYSRVSTNDQTTIQQEEELKKYCSMRGWDNITIYSDKVSGTKSSRKGLDEMMAAIRKHRHDKVLCYKIDRIGRSLSHLALLIGEFKTHGVALIVPSQGISTEEDNPAGALTLNILCAISEFERTLISERTKLALAHKKEQGITLGRPNKIDKIADKVRKLRSAGLSLSQISKEVSVSIASVRRALAMSCRPSSPSIPYDNDLKYRASSYVLED